MSLPILPFAVWSSGTNQNSIPANDNSLRNQILNGLVIDDATTAQPASPADGAIYILPATHTGAQWSLFDEDDLVIYSGGTWYAFAPVDGVVVNFDGSQQQYSAGAWSAFSGGGGMTNPMTTSQDLIVGGVAGAAGRLAVGTVNGQVLTVDGGNVAWKPPRIVQNSQSAAYTLLASDAGKHIYHPSADTTARIWTIPANSSVAFDIGTAVTFDNDFGAGAITISITTDTLVLVGAAGSTGSRTLASGGQATAIKVTSTRWRISGVGLT